MIGTLLLTHITYPHLLNRFRYSTRQAFEVNKITESILLYKNVEKVYPNSIFFVIFILLNMCFIVQYMHLNLLQKLYYCFGFNSLPPSFIVIKLITKRLVFSLKYSFNLIALVTGNITHLPVSKTVISYTYVQCKQVKIYQTFYKPSQKNK